MLAFGVRGYSAKAAATLPHSKGALHGIGVRVGSDCWRVDWGGGLVARGAQGMAVPADGAFDASARGGGRDADGSRVCALVEAAENHFACGRLVDGGDEDVHGAVDKPARAIHHHHGAVIE